MRLKKLYFMFNKFRRDFFRKPQPFPIADDVHSEKLGEYYFKFSEDTSKLNRLITSFDKDGIPLNTTYIDVANPKLHYYPISIGQYGLALFNSYILTRSEEKKAHFLRIADWFANNYEEDNKLGVYWLTDVPKPEYKVFNKWKSAFSQSRGLSVLLRAWQITVNSTYLDICKKALIPFTFDIIDGGVSATLKKGLPFYEEYVAKEPTMVLDGHIFSLFGIYDFIRSVPETVDKKHNALANQIFNQGINSLISYLPQFDLGFWLRFNLCQMDHYPKIDPCSIGYLRLVRWQLNILHKITNIDSFQLYEKKIFQYDRFYNKIKMYVIKYKALKKLNRL